MEAQELARLAAEALSDKKGEDIKIIDITGIADFADYFVIGTGNNPNQIEAMEEAVDEALTKAGGTHKNTEGNRDSNWILLDYGDVIIHIFDKESRSFYDLDRIWKDGRIVE